MMIAIRGVRPLQGFKDTYTLFVVGVRFVSKSELRWNFLMGCQQPGRCVRRSGSGGHDRRIITFHGCRPGMRILNFEFCRQQASS